MRILIKYLQFYLLVVRRYKQWVITEYPAMLKDGKDIIFPSWFWPNAPLPLVNSLLVGLLQADPNLRLSAAEAINHPWCQGMTYEEYKSMRSAEMNNVASTNTPPSLLVSSAV